MTKVLAVIAEPNNDPQVSIVDLDETKGMVPIGALNGVVKVEMVFLSNEQARSIRKHMDAGLRGGELRDAILQVLTPPPPEPAEKSTDDPALDNLQTINETGKVPANQTPAPGEPGSAENPLPPDQLPPVGEGNA